MQTEISELKIKTSGLTQDQAQSLGIAVGEAIQAGLPVGSQSTHIPELSIKLTQQAANDTEQMASQIAEQVLQKLKWHNY